MKKMISCLLMLLLMFSFSPKVFAADNDIVYTDSDYDRLHAVIQHVENVLKYGHEYNEDTNLLPDAINTLTGEPAKWPFPNRAEIPYADIANQQNFFRTLNALSIVTVSDKFHNEANLSLS